MKQDNSITNARVQILYGRALASITTAILAAVIFAYIFRGQIASPVLLAWLGVMFTLFLVRYWLVIDYNKNKQNTLHHKKFEDRFAYAAGFVGISWAFFIAWGLSLPVFEYRIYSLLLLVSVVSLSVPVFSSSIKTSFLYAAPPVIISIPLLLFRGGDDMALGFAMILFTAMVLRSSMDSYNSLRDTLVLRARTQELAESLGLSRLEKSAAEISMQDILDYAPAAIYVKDLDGHFLFLNQKTADLHQMKRDELVGKTLHDILPEDIADEIRQNDMDVIEALKSIEYEETSPLEDEHRHYISIKFPLFDEAGKVYAIGGISTDITERVHFEESFRISQQRLLLHREQSPLGVIEWNTDFEFLDWNPAAQRIFGYTKEDVVGAHITERILPESARPAVNKVWADLLANKGGTLSINENTTKDGRTILCEWHNTPLVDQNGNVIGVTSLVENITERQRSEENLRQVQKMDALGKLTGGIAHDFNNTLGIILGFAELLKMHMRDDDPKQVKYLGEVLNAAERAKKLTSKLLEFSRRTPTASEITHVNSLLSDMRHMLETTLTPRTKLEYELEEELWPVWLDRARLEDAVLNIAINSIHAMPDGGKFTLTTSNEHLSDSDCRAMNIDSGDYILLLASDTGTGMSQEVQERIFDPFFTTKGEGGTGLGLSQVYGYVQQSNGSIQVYSEPNQGSTIAIYIPRYEGPDAAQADELLAETAELRSGNETILVVDDEVALLTLTEEILANYGYKVICAESAEQALEILKEEPVDLMLSDVIMPGMDGYQLANEVETLYPKTRIQIVSGFSEDQQTNLANESLHQQRLLKPLNSEKVLRRVRDLLDG